MEFSWGEAARIALVGFSGVFIILFILQLSLKFTSTIVRKFGPKSSGEKEEKNQQ